MMSQRIKDCTAREWAVAQTINDRFGQWGPLAGLSEQGQSKYLEAARAVLEVVDDGEPYESSLGWFGQEGDGPGIGLDYRPSGMKASVR